MAMNGLSKMAATALLLVLAIVPAAIAVTHTVGDTQGWASGVDYTAWVTGKTFRVGDTLKFTYGPSHSVNEVSKAVYDNCAGTPIETHSDGDTTIDLDKVGPKYFLCPTSGHCLAGMKLAVTVVTGSSGTPGTPSPPSSTPGTPATPTTPDSPPAAGTPATPTPTTGSTSPPPPKGSGASKGVMMSYVLVGVSMVLGYGLWM